MIQNRSHGVRIQQDTLRSFLGLGTRAGIVVKKLELANDIRLFCRETGPIAFEVDDVGLVWVGTLKSIMLRRLNR
jgi:hypothetical protein